MKTFNKIMSSLLAGLASMAINISVFAHAPELHAQHQAPPVGYTRTVEDYVVPSVQLKNQSNTQINLGELLNQDRSTLLQFIFTSCATICPVLSANFAQVQNDIARISPNYQMVSISIDPEYDTPARLADYANQFKANSNWSFLTGSLDNIGQVLKSFDVQFQGNNKMYHQPYTFLQASADQPWVRYDGLMSAKSLTMEFQDLLSATKISQNE